nr:FIG01135415: hypothetical protein [Kibdelosporangium sp. MJ126-NF4]
MRATAECVACAPAQGCGSWGVPPVWPGRSHTTACREVGLRNSTRSAGGTDLPARRGFLWQDIREGRPAPPTRPGKSRGLSQPARETKRSLCPLSEACPPARHLCLFSSPHPIRQSPAQPGGRPCSSLPAITPGQRTTDELWTTRFADDPFASGTSLCCPPCRACSRRSSSLVARRACPRRTAGRREGNQPVVCPPGWLCSRDFLCLEKEAWSVPSRMSCRRKPRRAGRSVSPALWVGLRRPTSRHAVVWLRPGHTGGNQPRSTRLRYARKATCPRALLRARPLARLPSYAQGLLPPMRLRAHLCVCAQGFLRTGSLSLDGYLMGYRIQVCSRSNPLG